MFVWVGLNRLSMGKMAISCENTEILPGSKPDAGFYNVIFWYKIEFTDFLLDRNLFPQLLKFRNFPLRFSERHSC